MNFKRGANLTEYAKTVFEKYLLEFQQRTSDTELLKIELRLDIILTELDLHLLTRK